MKKKLSALLAIVLAFCMSMPVFAAPSSYPTTGELANQPSEFKIEKNYVTNDENKNAAQFPSEILQFESVCTAAPMNPFTTAPNLTIDPLTVDSNPDDIVVKVPIYSVPGKYNYKITEKSPSQHTPGSKDSAGVVYDTNPIYIQVVVKYTKEATEQEYTLKKFVTVAKNGTFIGTGNDLTQDAGKKKGDFKNKYLLDGELITPDPNPNPNPGPNPTPDPDKNPDPITPIPPEGGGVTPDKTELAKFKIMKQVRGPLASQDQLFDVTVTLTSEKPVRSDITYKGAANGTIKKVDNGSDWTGNANTGYTATLNLQLKDGQTVVFSGMPAEVTYKVQEDSKHIGKLDDTTLNDPSKGYTVAYYGGGEKVTNPTDNDPVTEEYGKGNFVTGTIGEATNNNIIIANSKGMNNEDSSMVKPNTGIRLDSLPYMMILGLVVLGAGVMVVKSRKRREE